MSNNVSSVKCPECGASVELNQHKRSGICDYCGTRVVLNDNNSFTFNIHDDAEVIHAETEQTVILKQLEWKEHRQKKELHISKKWIKRAKVLGAVGFVLLFIIGPMINFLPEDQAGDNFIEVLGGVSLSVAVIIASLYCFQWFKQKQADEETFDEVISEGIKLPSELSDYNFRTYHAAEDLLKEAGFTNVVTIPLRDVTKESLLIKPDFISKITINGNELRNTSKRYPSDAKIVISYHSYK